MAFFRKKKKKNETVIPEEKIETATAEEAVSTDEDAVYTTLVFHEEKEYTKPETYVLKFHHQQLPSLKPNQISISGIQLTRFEEDVIIEAFIRNTLSRAVRFEMVDLILLDENGQTLGKKSFDLSEMGEIPALSCIPWEFCFEEEDLVTLEMPTEGWKIAFELKQQSKAHALDLAPSWEEQLSPAQREHLEKVIAGLPKLGKDEVNFMGLEAVLQEEGKLAVTVLIRNGSTKSINIEQLPLIVEDADGDQVCQGGFSLTDFEVKANTTKPWTFIFPEQLVQKKTPNLTKWKVYPPDTK